jgi:hypothetical protein
MIAIVALIISFISLIGLIINLVFTARTYKRNRRLEFLQRRDHLSQKISDLNDRQNELHMTSARYALVVVKATGLPLRGEQAERNTALIARIEKQREFVENQIILWDENIEKLHFIYSNLTSESDAPAVERTIDIIRLASDDLKKGNNVYSSTLYTPETANEFIKTTSAEADEKIRQLNSDFEREIENIYSDFEKEIEKLNLTSKG